MAGGYDGRLTENVDYHQELKQLAASLGLSDHVTFLRSPDDDMKTCLLRQTDALLYTPDWEHFGIVPLEAMYCELPVVAVNSGGPLGTVEENQNGFLCNPTTEDLLTRRSFITKIVRKLKKWVDVAVNELSRTFRLMLSVANWMILLSVWLHNKIADARCIPVIESVCINSSIV